MGSYTKVTQTGHLSVYFPLPETCQAGKNEIKESAVSKELVASLCKWEKFHLTETG